jgi:glycosyltransferase involved in cell wall biosynthesis
MFLGRINADKGIEQAIAIAKVTHQKLIIVAKVDPPDRIYYRNIIRPLIDNKKIVYLGELDEKSKIEVLKDAKALISPIQWDEPFGMVNIEALACGVPVLSINRGSMPEIFKDAKVGYLCRDVADMIKKVGQIEKIKRINCRGHIEKYFTARIMAKNYLRTYRKVIRMHEASKNVKK